MQALFRALRKRRNRRLMLRRLREMAAEDEARERERQRVLAAWRAEAVSPEAMRMAAEMAVQA